MSQKWKMKTKKQSWSRTRRQLRLLLTRSMATIRLLRQLPRQRTTLPTLAIIVHHWARKRKSLQRWLLFQIRQVKTILKTVLLQSQPSIRMNHPTHLRIQHPSIRTNPTHPRIQLPYIRTRLKTPPLRLQPHSTKMRLRIKLPQLTYTKTIHKMLLWSCHFTRMNLWIPHRLRLRPFMRRLNQSLPQHQSQSPSSRSPPTPTSGWKNRKRTSITRVIQKINQKRNITRRHIRKART